MNVEMTRDEAREYLQNNASYLIGTLLPRDKSGKGYICPICGSGKGEGKKAAGTGITENPKYKGHFKCWAGCFDKADLIDIVGYKYGLTEYNDKLKRACEEYGIMLTTKHTNYTVKSENKGEYVADYKEFFTRAARNLSRTNYHRGISLETLKRFNVGYIESWKHPKTPNAPESPRLIIPVSSESYLARDTRKDLTSEQQKYSKQRVGNVSLFNATAINEATGPVYVVEGEFDALSIEDTGAKAVSLCSISNAKKFLDMATNRHSGQPFIISLDNDEAGQKTSESLCEELGKMQISFYRHDLPENFKDANEFLMHDREQFGQWVNEGIVACKEKVKANEQAEKEAFEQEAVAYQLENFFDVLKESREGKAISTGFNALDEILDGGLYPGLYVLGAISSLGKTTFALQIADNAAINGHGVLIFSLEMSRNELIAKTLSRLTVIKDMAENHTTRNAKTTRGILRSDFASITELELVKEAANYYTYYGRQIHITEGVGDVGINEIRGKIRQYMRFNNNIPPVVIIDYLQILSPYDVRATDKQNVDKSVLELKRLSRDYQIPIIGISSFNRENYSVPVSMASFKESGAIEYSSDVLIGLQYEGFDYQEGENENGRKERIRGLISRNNEEAKKGGHVKIQVKILKNRNGQKGDVLLDFYPMFNYFSISKELPKK